MDNKLLRLEREFLKAFHDHKRLQTAIAAAKLNRAEKALESYRGNR